MKKQSLIPPSERYNQHVNKVGVDTNVIKEVATRCGMTPQKYSIEILSGGFQNLNYLITQNDRKIVARFYSTDSSTARKEFSILKFLNEQKLSVPKVHEYFEIEGKYVVTMDFVDGLLFQEQLTDLKGADLETFYLIGRELAKIHSIELPHPGFIQSDMQIGTEFENFGSFLRNYIIRVFLNVQKDRIEAAVVNRLLKLVDDQWHLVTATEPVSHLVHCDFNPKNILIAKGQQPALAAIIDWEFSISGNGYIDIGNFFRFPEDYPKLAEREFIEGYRSLKPELSEHWKEVALLMDLGNMASFMERKEDYQKTFRTARHVIDSTLTFFGY